MANIHVLQEKLACKAQLQHQMFSVHVYQQGPDPLITHQLVLLLLNASAAASLVTTSTSVQVPSSLFGPPATTTTAQLQELSKAPNALKQKLQNFLSLPLPVNYTNTNDITAIPRVITKCKAEEEPMTVGLMRWKPVG